MAKAKRKGRKTKGAAAPTYGSDDERTYLKEDVPDTTSDSYYHDEVDQFHIDRDKIMLDSRSQRASELVPEQDEVLGFDDDSDDEEEVYEDMKKRLHLIRSQGFHDEMASDLEDEPEGQEKEKIKEKAWGSTRSKFYGGHDSDIDEDLSGSEPEAAALEEQEALAIQKRLLQALDEDDMGLDMFKPAEKGEEESEEKITKDLSKMSKREKLKLLRKKSPELLDIIADYKTRAEELQKKLLPVLKLIRNKKLPTSSSGAQYIETKTKLYMNYLVNVSFYLMLKAKQTPVENHPVIKRLLQYINLMKELDESDHLIESELNQVLDKLEKGDEFETIVEDPEETETTGKFKSVLLKKSKKLKEREPKKRLPEDGEDSEDLDVEPATDIGGRTWGRKRSRLEGDEDAELAPNDEAIGALPEADAEEMAEDESERRGINYQIEKNKGLTTRKRKELRNPRVKNKLKYRKAKIRRRGQIREVRTEMSRYGGEASGIRAGIKRSIRLK